MNQETLRQFRQQSSGRRVRGLPEMPRLVRVALAAMLGLSLALVGCASTRVPTAGETDSRAWGWCDHVHQGRPTVLCFQR
jgi:hypothetical protein